jgi:uncharacterized protein (TIGR03083 family)
MGAMTEPNPFDLMEAEANRIDSFYSGLEPKQWVEPTRCPGWDRKDLLAHLLGIEEYTEACLADRVDEYLAQSDEGFDDLNELLVRRHAQVERVELLKRWRERAADNRLRLRDRGTESRLATSAGLYPLGRQAYYLACELAIHADDAGVPVPADEVAGRQAWRAWFGREALAESAPQVEVADVGDGTRVRLDGVDLVLPEAEFVEATSGRLPADHPLPAQLRRTLTVLA